ncbi:hypothetical protein [Lentilactobacillus buchneri]|nr:hypothetical protein [Lentilactobacillus buchneri]
MEKGKLHQYFDSNIQPILNMAIGVRIYDNWLLTWSYVLERSQVIVNE